MIPPQMTVSVSLTLITLDADEIKAQVCPTCFHLMELHQPDSGFPERLLWTCEYCATWFLMDLDPDKREALLVCLPDHGHFRSAIPDVG
jgi:hypothetical protein